MYKPELKKSMDITYWYLFPLGIIISAMAMSAGIPGANFWIPVYLFILKLDPLISFWVALLTMVFGFGSGVIRNLYQHTVNWYIVRKYLIPTIQGVIIGSILSGYMVLCIKYSASSSRASFSKARMNASPTALRFSSGSSRPFKASMNMSFASTT